MTRQQESREEDKLSKWEEQKGREGKAQKT